MPIILTAFILILSSAATADQVSFDPMTEMQCRQVFSNPRPPILNRDADLYVDIKQRLVLWKGHRVVLSETRLRILTLILKAGDVVSADDILLDLYGARGGGEDPMSTLKVQISQIRTAFRAVDPEFDQIKRKRGAGYYWQKDHSELEIVRRGPLSVALHLYQAWWDGQSVHLTPSQHAILLRLLRRGQPVPRRSFLNDHASDISLRVTVSHINRKFEPLLRDALIVSSGWGAETGVLQLNAQLNLSENSTFP